MQGNREPICTHNEGDREMFFFRFSLIELVVVLVILVAVAGVVVGLVGGSINQSRQDATRVNLERIREVIVGSADQPGYVGDMRQYPHPGDALILAGREDHPQLNFLFRNPEDNDVTNDFDPISKLGWRGPYLLHSTGTYSEEVERNFFDDYGEDGDPAMIDAWGNPIIIQEPSVGTPEEREINTRLISAGSDGVIDTPRNQLEPDDLSDAERGDDLILFLRVADTGA